MNIGKAWGILARRLREQGLWTTMEWVWGRGIPKLTGVPLFAYSRITPQLYVGPQYNMAGRRAIEREGITGVVNMRVEYDDAAHGLALARYCHLPTVDDDSPSLEHLQQGVAFVDEVVNDGGKVYVHCKGGIGRAPTMAAAYLISQGMSVGDAVACIKQTRPFINITPPQMEALQRYAAAITGPSPATRQPVPPEM